MHTHIHAHTHTHTHTHTHAHTHTHTHKHTHTHTHTHTLMHRHRHTHASTDTHARTHTYTHTHPATETRADSPPSFDSVHTLADLGIPATVGVVNAEVNLEVGITGHHAQLGHRAVRAQEQRLTLWKGTSPQLL